MMKKLWILLINICLLCTLLRLGYCSEGKSEQEKRLIVQQFLELLPPINEGLVKLQESHGDNLFSDYTVTYKLILYAYLAPLVISAFRDNDPKSLSMIECMELVHPFSKSYSEVRVHEDIVNNGHEKYKKKLLDINSKLFAEIKNVEDFKLGTFSDELLKIIHKGIEVFLQMNIDIGDKVIPLLENEISIDSLNNEYKDIVESFKKLRPEFEKYKKSYLVNPSDPNASGKQKGLDPNDADKKKASKAAKKEKSSAQNPLGLFHLQNHSFSAYMAGIFIIFISWLIA